MTTQRIAPLPGEIVTFSIEGYIDAQQTWQGNAGPAMATLVYDLLDVDVRSDIGIVITERSGPNLTFSNSNVALTDASGTALATGIHNFTLSYTADPGDYRAGMYMVVSSQGYATGDFVLQLRAVLDDGATPIFLDLDDGAAIIAAAFTQSDNVDSYTFTLRANTFVDIVHQITDAAHLYTISWSIFAQNGTRVFQKGADEGDRTRSSALLELVAGTYTIVSSPNWIVDRAYVSYNLSLQYRGVFGTSGNDTIVGVLIPETLPGQDRPPETTISGGPGPSRLGPPNPAVPPDPTPIPPEERAPVSIRGNEGDDTLQGGHGNDRIDGGADQDIAIYTGNRSDYGVTHAPDGYIISDLRVDAPDGADTVTAVETFVFSDVTLTATGLNASIGTVTEGADTLYGTPDPDLIDGLGGDDVISGLQGADTLNGGTGADTLVGGTDNDTYIVDDAGDVVVELANGGTADIVRSSRSYVLPAEVESLLLTGALASDGTGNALANLLTGNDGANVLRGLAGADTLIGAAGDDRLHADGLPLFSFVDDFALAASPLWKPTTDTWVVVDGRYASTLSSTTVPINTLLDQIIVGDFTVIADIADATDGGIWLRYAQADGTFAPVDGVLLVFGFGGRLHWDTWSNGVRTGGINSVSGRYVQGDDVSVRIEVRGDVFSAYLNGATTATTTLTFAGLRDGRIALYDNSGQSFDRVSVSEEPRAGTLDAANEGNLLQGGAGSDTLMGAAGADTLDGGDGNDSLVGGMGNDALFGGVGADTLVGGGGNDIYLVETNADRVVELAGGGDADVIRSGVSRTLDAQVERLELLDLLAAQSGIGNAAANLITGNSFANALSGLAGGDTLLGLGGADTLTGGAGNDSLDGGADNDVVVFSGNRGDYGVTAIADGYLIADLRAGSPDGTDTVLGVDVFRFANGDLSATGMLAATTIFGTEAADTLSGTAAAEVLDARGGGDSVLGGAGNDTLLGGAGMDYLHGGAGNDELSDSLNGGRLYGDAGDDRLALELGGSLIDGLPPEGWGGDGNDTLSATGRGLDGVHGVTFLGEEGNDSLTGAESNDDLRGGNGNDFVTGSVGHDLLSGQGGADTLVGGAGSDSLDGGADNDLAVFSGNRGDYSASAIAGGYLITDLRAGAPEGIDTLLGVEMVRFADGDFTSAALLGVAMILGTDAADTLTGTAAGEVIEGRGGDDSLSGGSGGDTLQGGLGADTLLGDAGMDYLHGGAGNDALSDSLNGGRLYGEAGDDRLALVLDGSLIDGLPPEGWGGDGNDTLVATGRGLDGVHGVTFLGEEGNDSLTGAESNDDLRGGNGNDFVAGGVGHDLLSGQAGADTLVGGAGNDSLDGGADGDVAVFSGNRGSYGATAIAGGYLITDLRAGAPEGIDTVLGVETFRFADGDVTEAGLLGAPTIPGTDAAETITGTAAREVIDARGGDDSLIGGAGDDTLWGGLGADTLNGGTGNDRLEGGAGNDTYLVTEAGDAVVELAGGGTTDLVRAGLSHTLGAEVERLLLTGTALDGTGNSLANLLTGHAGANALSGLDGADTLRGLAGADTLTGGAGGDSLDGGDGEDVAVFSGNRGDYGVTTIAGGYLLADLRGGAPDGADTVLGVETFRFADRDVAALALATAATISGTDAAETLTGTAAGEVIDARGGDDNLLGVAGADTLFGGLGADTLDGGAGPDRMEGGGGNDVYVVDAAEDLVVEAAGGGTIDQLRTSLTMTLPVEVERLVLLGAANLAGTGNALANLLTGNAGANALLGLAGNDTLRGLAGADTLNGGTGNDNIIAGDDDDLLVLGAGADTLDGGAGSDTLIFEAGFGAGGMAIDLRGPMQVTAGGQASVLLGIEVIIGGFGAGADTFFGGGSGDDRAAGLGNDRLDGGGGGDTLRGEGGADTLAGGAGSDLLDGGAEADLALFTGSRGDYGVTTLAGGGFVVADLRAGAPDGADTVLAVESFRFADGDVAAANLAVPTGTPGGDTMLGGSGADSLDGLAGDDTLIGQEGDDTLLGGIGNDLLRGGAADDAMAGGLGVDTLVGGAGDDTLNGGGGIDLADYSAAFSEVVVDLGAGTAEDGDAGFDVLSGIEALRGSAFDDLLRGSEADETFLASAGADTVIGGDGFDTLSFADATAGVYADLDDGVALGGVEISGIEALTGGALADILGGDAGANLLSGGGGDDLLSGSGGNDTLDGGGGNDTMSGGIGSDVYVVDSIGDVVLERASEGIDVVRTRLAAYALGPQVEGLVFIGSGSFQGIGNASANSMRGGAGADTLSGMGGNDVLRGGGGADLLIGGAGIDRFVLDSLSLGTTTTIQDLDRGSRETIDLTLIDAVAATAEDDAFAFIGTAGFSGLAGQLRWTELGAMRRIEGDVNGDSLADLTILLGASGPVEAKWFLL